MREIPISGGNVALVDDEDFEMVSAYSWYMHDGYARASLPRINGKQKNIFMHRLVSGDYTSPNIDHRDTNRLNNTRLNLRASSFSENSCNRGLQWDNKSGFKGVSFHKASGKWRAQLCKGGKKLLNVCFKDIQEAAHAYNKAAIEHHGDFAVLNPIGEDKVFSQPQQKSDTPG